MIKCATKGSVISFLRGAMRREEHGDYDHGSTSSARQAQHGKISMTSLKKPPMQEHRGKQLKTKPWAALLETIMNLQVLTKRNNI